MGNIIDWFKKHKIQIGMHINEKRPSCTPLHVWWIYLLVVAEFSRLTTTTFKCLQGHHVTVLMNQTHLLTMETSLLHVVDGCSPLSDSEATALDESEWVLLECHRLSASISGAKQLAINRGSFVMDKVALVDAPGVERLVKDFSNIYVLSAAGVDVIVDEHNAPNKSDKALPPVIPHQLAALSHHDFCSVVRTHQERLVATGWTVTCLYVMEQKHQDLVQSVSAKPVLHAALSLYNHNVLFDSGWSVV